MRTLSRIIIVLLAVSVVCTAEPVQFKVTPTISNQVRFTSKAPLETVSGHTNQISGQINLDPQDLSQPVAGWFEVQMASLDTDNKTRDKHMRNNHLNTDEYPVSRFEFNKVTGLKGKMPDNEFVEFSAEGIYALHGVQKTINPSVSARWNSAKGSIEVVARFDVLLSDYNIPRPKFLVMKLDEKQMIEVKFTALSE